MKNDILEGKVRETGNSLAAWGLWLLVTALLVAVAVRFLDRSVSTFVQEKLYHNKVWGTLTRELPDTLLIMVVVISVSCYVLYLARNRNHIHDRLTFALRYVSYSLPVSFVVKSILKPLFGRIETRFWLENPGQYGFHWLHGGEHFNGFPSGHMAVFATLCAAIWRIYPQHKKVLWFCLIVLALLLIGTNYHFLGDVIAGTYTGLIIEAVMFSMMGKRWSQPEKV